MLSIQGMGQDEVVFVDEGRGWCFLRQMAFLFLTRLHFQNTHPPSSQAFPPS